jgi:L-ascorbate metabolism protein UlaG (beta-lactamase superfamily)
MRLTKLGHACVRIETNGVRIVIDPGAFSAPDALAGADAVLVTHEHFDHVVPEKLVAAAEAAPNLRVWTTRATAEQLAALGNRVTAVRHGDRFDIAGVDINVYGEHHALIHRDVPVTQNVGFRVNGEVYHPGDSYTVPEDSTPILLAPDGGPWLRVSELIDFVREVAPKKAYLIHDAVLTEAGQNVVAGALTRLAGESYGCEIINWQPGDSIDTD